jgi:hypothetical protein
VVVDDEKRQLGVCGWSLAPLSLTGMDEQRRHPLREYQQQRNPLTVLPPSVAGGGLGGMPKRVVIGPG